MGSTGGVLTGFYLSRSIEAYPEKSWWVGELPGAPGLGVFQTRASQSLASPSPRSRTPRDLGHPAPRS